MKVPNYSIIAVVIMAIAFASLQQAQAQLERLPFKRSTNSVNTLKLTESVGPWLIMCYSFSGDDGAQQAQRLAAELRNSYKLDAYTYTHRFDLTEKIRNNALIGTEYVRLPNGDVALGADGKPMLRDENLVPASNANIAETAVVVGSFSSVEDERAQKVLEKIKKLAPKTLAGGDPDALANDDSLAGGTLEFYRKSVNRSRGRQGNALSNAFLLPNPLLPEDYFTAHSIDKFVIDLNKKVRRYGLLDCPGKYSVRVATFRGRTEINANRIKEQMDDLNWRKVNGKGVESQLAECANKADMLTKALRDEGVEAWIFHDREESYVCVGSFDWLKRTDETGNEVQNPLVRQTILKYRGSVRHSNGNPVAVGVPVPKSLQKLQGQKAIAYDIQPLPVVAPKAPKGRMAKLFSKWR
jgi:hypothetical protein